MSKQSDFEIDEADAEVQRIDCLRGKAQQKLTELEALLKRVESIHKEERQMFCRPHSYDVWDTRLMDAPLYDGPSLLEALRVLVDGKAQ